MVSSRHGHCTTTSLLLTRYVAKAVVSPCERAGHARNRVCVPAERDGQLQRVHEGIVVVVKGFLLGGRVVFRICRG